MSRHMVLIGRRPFYVWIKEATAAGHLRDGAAARYR